MNDSVAPSLLKLAGLGHGGRRAARVAERRGGVAARRHPHGAHAARRRTSMGPVGRVDTERLQPHGLSSAAGISRTCRRTSARSSIARRRGRTARCCASTSSSPSIARSRSRPASSFRPGPSTARCPARRCAPPKATASGSRSSTRARTRTRFTSTAGIRPRWTGRCRSTRSCRAASSSTSSTPSRSACTSITATRCR